MSMISQEEYAILQEKKNSLIKVKEDYAKTIEEEEEKLRQINQFRAQIDQLEKQMAEDEPRQNQEIQDASHDLKVFKESLQLAASKPIKGEKRLEKIKKDNESLKAKSIRLESTLSDLKCQCEVNEKSEAPLIKREETLHAVAEDTKNMALSIPLPGPVLIHLDDLKCQVQVLREKKSRFDSEIPTMSKQIEEQQKQNSDLKTEIVSVSTSINQLTEKITETENSNTQKIAELKQISESVAKIDQETEKEKASTADYESKRSEIEAKRAEALAVLEEKANEVRVQIAELEKKEKSSIHEDAVIEQRKKQTIEELERKIGDLREEIIKKRANSPEVMEKNKAMEQLWFRHQRSIDDLKNGKVRLARMREELRRKLVAIEEISINWPVLSRDKRDTGIRELDRIYEEATVQNKKLGSKLASLKCDLEAVKMQNEVLQKEVAKL